MKKSNFYLQSGLFFTLVGLAMLGTEKFDARNQDFDAGVNQAALSMFSHFKTTKLQNVDHAIRLHIQTCIKDKKTAYLNTHWPPPKGVKSGAQAYQTCYTGEVLIMQSLSQPMTIKSLLSATSINDKPQPSH